ncbi:hypothetical protein TNCV_1419331 [Trichonephila clavipes]|nr:hypothetical protein TNCV_1419331 [Trichonephila clavipes]
MYKNALKEDFIRVVEKLDGTVESTDTIVKLKTKIENSSTFESDQISLKLIKNCIDERVSLKRKRAKVEEKQFETLNKETATHIGIREAEDWFRPIDLTKECDIYISSRSGSHKEIPITYGYTQDPFKNKSQNFKTKIKENYPQYHEREKKIAIYAVIHLITQETPWQWKRRKKRNRFEQTSRTLQRKISMRSTKDQLVEKDVLMPVKHNVFLWNLPDVEEVPSHDGETV